mgnify:CR=1 FL=1
MFDESDKVSAYVKQKNIGMKIDYSGKARRVLKESETQNVADEESQAEENGASRAMRRIIQQKLLNGDELMADEMRFLKRFDSGLYTKARAAQEARETLVQKLEAATSKEEASEAFLVASGLVNEAGNNARQKEASEEKIAHGIASPTSVGAARDALTTPKPRTRWKLDLTDKAAGTPAAGGTRTRTAAKPQPARAATAPSAARSARAAPRRPRRVPLSCSSPRTRRVSSSSWRALCRRRGRSSRRRRSTAISRVRRSVPSKTSTLRAWRRPRASSVPRALTATCRNHARALPTSRLTAKLKEVKQKARLNLFNRAFLFPYCLYDRLRRGSDRPSFASLARGGRASGLLRRFPASKLPAPRRRRRRFPPLCALRSRRS